MDMASKLFTFTFTCVPTLQKNFANNIASPLEEKVLRGGQALKQQYTSYGGRPSLAVQPRVKECASRPKSMQGYMDKIVVCKQRCVPC